MDPMKPQKAALLNIVVSLVFAAAILISSFVLVDEKLATTVMFVLIALWWIPFSYLSTTRQKRSLKSEYLCLKRSLANRFKY